MSVIKVTYTLADTEKQVNEILSTISSNPPKVLACDFETANKLNRAERQALLEQITPETDWEIERKLRQQIEATGLSHPSLTKITHFTCAYSKDTSFVIVTLDPIICNTILDFLISYEGLQVWHNCQFDFKYIWYYRQKLPKQYADTMLIAKTKMNNCNDHIAKVGLKDLMGKHYGTWGIANETEFEIDTVYNKTMLQYTATDSAATWLLYQELMKNEKISYRI